jgi:hypothetical protein
VSAEFQVELVDGPHDGEALSVPRVCDCCGEHIRPGSVITWKGDDYKLNSTGRFAYFMREARAA